MKPRMGRPTNDPKTIKLQIRVSQETLDELDEYAKKLDTSRSEIVRTGIKLVGESLKKE